MSHLEGMTYYKFGEEGHCFYLPTYETLSRGRKLPTDKFFYADWWACQTHSLENSKICYYILDPPGEKDGTDKSVPPCWGKCPFSNEKDESECVPIHQGSTLHIMLSHNMRHDDHEEQESYCEGFFPREFSLSCPPAFFDYRKIVNLFFRQNFDVNLDDYVKIDHPQNSVVKRAIS